MKSRFSRSVAPAIMKLALLQACGSGSGESAAQSPSVDAGNGGPMQWGDASDDSSFLHDRTLSSEAAADAPSEAIPEDAPFESDIATGDAPDGGPAGGDGMSDAGAMADAGADTGPVPCDGPGARFATDIVSSQFGAGQDFGRDRFPAIVFGPPRGGGAHMGSLDAVSLGSGGTVTIAFAGNAIVDGPGSDFLVFENPFYVTDDATKPYAEVGTVEVSSDGQTWVAFPCSATSYPYGSCAGWHPVFANSETNTLEPTNPEAAGGDPFDLADVGLSMARYVRITDRIGDGFVFDLDAVAIVHPMCP